MKPSRPRGYLGIGHETIGSDVLALVRALVMPQAILGEAMATRLAALDPEKWYPIAELLEPLERIADTLGEDALRKTGRTLFAMSHEQQAKGVIKSARDLVYGFDGLYRHANRGRGIGGWEVVSFEPGECKLDKTTPHHCALEEGIMRAAMQMVGVPVNFEQPQCLRKGDDHCRFVITSVVIDERWSGVA